MSSEAHAEHGFDSTVVHDCGGICGASWPAPARSRNPPAAPAGSNEVTFELTGTRWALVRLGDQPVKISEGGREAYIALNSADGSVVGYAGCNRISSTHQSNGVGIAVRRSDCDAHGLRRHGDRNRAARSDEVHGRAGAFQARSWNCWTLSSDPSPRSKPGISRAS